MKAHKLTVFIIDFDSVGDGDIVGMLENQRFPNDCINLRVKGIETADIGEWSDNHPLNKRDTCKQEYERLFTK